MRGGGGAGVGSEPCRANWLKRDCRLAADMTAHINETSSVVFIIALAAAAAAAATDDDDDDDE